MTPFERLSAVRSEVAHTDMLLLSLLALEDSTSSAPPATDKDRPREKEGEGKKMNVVFVVITILQQILHCSQVIFCD